MTIINGFMSLKTNSKICLILFLLQIILLIIFFIPLLGSIKHVYGVREFQIERGNNPRNLWPKIYTRLIYIAIVSVLIFDIFICIIVFKITNKVVDIRCVDSSRLLIFLFTLTNIFIILSLSLLFYIESVWFVKIDYFNICVLTIIGALVFIFIIGIILNNDRRRLSSSTLTKIYLN